MTPRRPASSLPRTAAVSAVLAALSLIGVACGADDPSSSTTTSVGPTTTTTTPDGGGPTPSTTGQAADRSGPFAWTGSPKGNGALDAVKVKAVAVTQLDQPTVLAQRPPAGRFYAAERAGRIRMLTPLGDGLRVTGRPVLDITDDTTTDVERGLLGMTFSADGKVLYVSHTNKDGNSRLESYDLRADGTADTSSKQVLLAQEQPFANHNGGNVVLGPDGDLYFGFGDGGSGDDPDNRAQNPQEWLGKILRIDPTHPEGGKPYAIPTGNPYRSGGGRPEIYLSGVRNPWRFSFDRATGDLWIGDVGQNKVEEVDWLTKGTGAGRNLGWSGYEGSAEYLDGAGRRPAKSTPPVFEYRHDDGACSITGGFVYRGKQIKALQGAYLFADYCVGEVRALVLGANSQVADERVLDVQVDQPISFAQDADGELYVLSQAGGVYRLEPA